MAVVVIGGHSRGVGKTSVVAGLISALREFEWMAIKITHHRHGLRSADGAPDNRESPDHSWTITEESDRSGQSDTSRFLLAGAARALWVRTEPGTLADVMPALRVEVEKAGHVIIESNSVMRFLRPDLYLTVLDPAREDFKDSAREFLGRADAVILRETSSGPAWPELSLTLVAKRPIFRIAPPNYVSPEAVDFVRGKLGARKKHELLPS